jgi:formate-dependent nitrite reductase membrane component NrfD
MRMVPEAQPVSYHGRAILKPPVWRREVPIYFFFSGLSGASATLALVARARRNPVLARRARLAALLGIGAAPPLLIADLGRPERFHHMLRVFKPTSPMSVGTWLLSAFGLSTGAAAASDVLGVAPRIRRSAEIVSGVLGPALATYTSVLLADTAVPVWHEARADLPLVFAAGAAMSAGAVAAALTPMQLSRPARRLAAGAALAEVLAARRMRRRLGDLAKPYSNGDTGELTLAAEVLTATGGALMALARRRSVAVVAAATLLGGALCQRFAIFFAGFDSTRDPQATIAPQRARIAATVGDADLAPRCL